MESTRTYGEACAAAHALDLIGERWALLIVRELLLGPKRFSDLRTGLPHIGPNRLTQRLRDLEDWGIVQRRKLGPPTGSWVYEVTDWGHELETVLIQLGRWGRRSPFRDLDAHIGVDSLMLALRGDFHPRPGDDLDATYVLRFDDDQFVVRVKDGVLDVARGSTQHADAAMDTDARTFAALLTGKLAVDDAVRAGSAKVTGDAGALDRLFAALPRPLPAR